mmetsp:Transcript_48926/g.72717  ORF Transcript_48926/g.72717 Transcript_48926/m.72717 type:complete len:354 (-) Transcript_48926:17-1078(-)|eukprot:CAMPEP_0195514424 /NCGR_PEP_ID=MMETSP0794_2-20130614/5817_1 /TAXON_ID=515487 /ORGANISM="Stephanopyxis turris, Strain CCMP 815" /LENGTH=353 /DNA_ID=CAMNT_0040642667 /DNA_START=59 /DNA_END=1120 /DNA_ORIENTATION=+
MRLNVAAFVISLATCATISTVEGFGLPSNLQCSRTAQSTRYSFGVARPVNMSEKDETPEIPKQSYLEGNRRDPTPNEISIMDDMITKLSQSEAYELPGAVSKAIRVISSPRFFMRIAERTDMAETELEKEKLSTLASNLVSTLEAVVSTTEDRLDERAENVESVVKAAAEPDSGEFLVPLIPERVEAMRAAILKLEPASLDEGFLTTVDAWMNKSMQDGMDGMVGILQKVLQIYAGIEISRARDALLASVGAAVTGSDEKTVDEVMAAQKESPSPASALFEELLGADTDVWDAKLKNELGKDGSMAPQVLMGEVQRTIEGVVLGLENGSMAQRVQAEYLRELVTRIEAIESTL